MELFEDRVEAGKQLSKHLETKIDVDTVVIPYEQSYEVAREVALFFEADVLLRLTEFISSPGTPQTNIGAVVEDDTIWIEDGLKEELDVSSEYIRKSARIKSDTLKTKSTEINPENNIRWKDRNFLIVSDGISSGFREMAVAGSLMKKGAGEIHVATPQISENTMADLESVTEDVFFLGRPSFISSPEACYVKNYSIR